LRLVAEVAPQLEAVLGSEQAAAGTLLHAAVRETLMFLVSRIRLASAGPFEIRSLPINPPRVVRHLSIAPVPTGPTVIAKGDRREPW
jgi:hypothetical protein